jgi:alpha-tubulin suppressor-like RCC1 family protein
VGTETTWDTFDTNRDSVFAVRGGALYAWGDNLYTQLGVGGSDRSSPVQVGALTNWKKAVGTGIGSAVAVKTDGTLWGWGFNSRGEIGNNTATTVNSPVQIGTDTDWSDVSGQNNVTMALKSDGSLYLYGENDNGQIGDNTIINRSSPVQLGSGTDWNLISSGGSHALAVKTDGTMWGWGRGANGQLGQGSTVSYSSPVQVGSLTNWAEISAAPSFSGARTSSNAVYTWGRGALGSLGQNVSTDVNTPTQVTGTWTSISSTQNGFFAVDGSSNLYMFGGDTQYMTSDGGARYRSSPTQISTVSNAYRVVSGDIYVIYTEAVE